MHYTCDVPNKHANKCNCVRTRTSWLTLFLRDTHIWAEIPPSASRNIRVKLKVVPSTF